MTEFEAQTAPLITVAAVRGALSSMRHAQSRSRAAARPLLALGLVEAHLRDEGIVDTPANRGWALEHLLSEIVWQRLAGLRGEEDARRHAESSTPEVEVERLAADLRSGSNERESWSLLYIRFLSLTDLSMGTLPERFGIGRRTITRRLQAGLAALAAELQRREAALPAPAQRAASLEPVERIRVQEGRSRTATAAPEEERGNAGGARARLREMVVLEQGAGGDEAAPAADPAAALIAALRDGGPIATVSPEALLEVARRPIGTLRDYRLARLATWCAPSHRLDRRFVRLGLMLDRGREEAKRWALQTQRYDGLAPLLDDTLLAAVVLLGPPGSGKSSLLRHHELQLASRGLRGESGRLSFYLPLNAYGGASGRGDGTREGVNAPDPLDWIADSWRRRHPNLPSMSSLLSEGRVTLLLDGLNEMPHTGAADYARRVDRWRLAIAEVAARPGNRLVFTCRNLDFSSPLSSEVQPVPQARLEPLTDADIQRFLHVHVPARAEAIWQAVRRDHPALRELLRTPLMLRLFIEQAGEEDALPQGEAALFGGFVRRALRREIERGSTALAPGDLLDERDRRGLLRRRGQRRPHALPEGGVLIRGLERLAHGMQERTTASEMGQVRVSRAEAKALLGPTEDGEQAEAVLAAGAALGLLDEDELGEGLFFAHQRFQEYFAARTMARAPRFELVARPWRADEVPVDLSTTIAQLAPAETLPELPATGWEETTQLAAQMTENPASFFEALMVSNLVVAGRAARHRELPAPLLDRLRGALIERSRDIAADLRERIASGRALGDLGDPRFSRHEGPHGICLLPPMVALPAGEYTIGTDEVLRVYDIESHAERPRHRVTIDAFAIGQFHVTNAEWACFIEAGGYEDPRWWRSETARAWRRGENTSAPDKMVTHYWLRRLRKDEGLLAELRESGSWPERSLDNLEHYLSLDAAALEATLDEHYPNRRYTTPRFWNDPRLNHPSQPVVGISLVEAHAYAAWLSANSGRRFRVPTEIELEAAARGLEGRTFACGDTLPHAYASNSLEVRTGSPSPIGIFPESDTPEGVSDLMGNVLNVSRSRWGAHLEATDFAYPYDPTDGREFEDPGEMACFVARGGHFCFPATEALAYARCSTVGVGVSSDSGLRLVERQAGGD